MTLPDVVVPFLLGLAAAAGVAAVAAGVTRRRWRQLEAELRGSRNRQAAFDEISEVWQWQTDPAHRLVDLRAPAAKSGAVADGAAAPFWQRFGEPGSAALEGCMKAGAALDHIDLDSDAWQEKKRSFRLRGRALRDSAGSFTGYVGTLREIIVNPAATAAAITAAPSPAAMPTAAAPSEADHEALGTLVSHDLRAPIRVIEGFTRIVKEDYANVLDGIGHDHLDRVLGAAGRMNHMIDALLALSRLGSQPIAQVPVDLSQLASYIVEDLRRPRPEHAVEVEIEPGMTAEGDPTLLRMVLENLLGNAWKYTGNARGPKISFVRDPHELDTFVVRDNGAGFDMRYADRLFNIFQRLHSASEFPGTGVGLASVRRIVRRHGGEICAEGEPGRGASFRFSLPHPAAAA